MVGFPGPTGGISGAFDGSVPRATLKLLAEWL
jgi:hypothetical protein